MGHPSVAAVARPRFDVVVGRLARRHLAWSWPIGLVAIACAWAFDRVVVHGSSMSPTFHPGDRLLLVRRLRRLRPGDLVAFDDPRGTGLRLVKRVVSIDEGVVEVAGDNATSSTDSRAFGPVRHAAIRHLVVRRYGVEGRRRLR
jgi:nickel-type superoxide dismutase maturation protease